MSINAGRQSIPNGKGIYRRSGGRNTYSSLASSKGAVYMNPDGTFVYCINEQQLINLVNPYKNESILSARRSTNSLSSENQQIILPVFGDDELAFFINPSDLPEFVDEVLESYLNHSKIFLVFLIFQLLIEGVYDYLTYCNKEYTLRQLAVIYPNVSYHELNKMYLLCLIGIIQLKTNFLKSMSFSLQFITHQVSQEFVKNHIECQTASQHYQQQGFLFKFSYLTSISSICQSFSFECFHISTRNSLLIWF